MRVFLPLFLTFLFACNQGKLQSDTELVERIGEQALSNEQRFRLSTLTNFDWDSLLILAPYASYEDWEDSLNINLSSVKHVMINSSDHINHLIFFNSGKIVKSCEPSRYPGDFAKNGSRLIKSTEDSFQVITTRQKTMGSKDWIDLIWIDPTKTEDFNTFLSLFNNDSSFQLSRVKFPHEQEIIDPHEGGEGFLIFEDSTDWIWHLNLEYKDEFNDGLELEYEQDTIWANNKVTIQQRGNFSTPNSKWHCDYEFTNIEGNWYLTNSRDLSY